MEYNELVNIQNEFISLSNDLLNSTEDTFYANLFGFKEFCKSNQIITDILKSITKTDFDGIEYFNKKSNPEYKFEKFPKPKTRNELLKVSYDLLLEDDLNAHHIINYAVWALHPDTTRIDELLYIGTHELFEKFIKYIDLELTKLITNTKKANTPDQLNFNIQSVSGSIIGTQQNATINNGLSFDDVEKYIHARENISSTDKEQLLELNNYLKTLAENNVPMSKGILARFSDIVSKHSWFPTLVGDALIKHFIG